MNLSYIGIALKSCASLMLILNLLFSPTDVGISVLLKMLDGLSKRPDGRISCAAFRGVLEGFSSQEAPSGDQLLQVCHSVGYI